MLHNTLLNTTKRLELSKTGRDSVVKFKAFLFRDQIMWKEGGNASISHYNTRSGDIATKAHLLKELRSNTKGDGGMKSPKGGIGKKRTKEETNKGCDKSQGQGANKKSRTCGPSTEGE